MACGCGKNKTKTPFIRSVTSARSVYAPSPRSPVVPVNQSVTPQQPINPAGINAEKKKVQSLRRDAIRKSLNK